jgi:hypothetical protein
LDAQFPLALHLWICHTFGNSGHKHPYSVLKVSIP